MHLLHHWDSDKMVRKAIAPHSILGTAEIFAVFGILSLYFLEFIGIHSFSSLLPPDSAPAQIPALDFTSFGREILISIGTIQIMAIVAIAILIYFTVIRKRLYKRLKI